MNILPEKVKTGSITERLSIQEFKAEVAKIKPGQSLLFFVSEIPSEQDLRNLEGSLNAIKGGYIFRMTPDEKAKTITVGS